jgi:hypothetical protein
MRRFVFAVAAVLAVLVAAAALPPRAGAMTMTAPAGLAAAIAETSAAEEVYGGCRRWYGHHRWHRSCGWRGWGWGWPFPFLAPWPWHHRHWGWHHRHHRGWW